MMSPDPSSLLFSALKAGLLLGIVYLLCRLFRRASAAPRYFVLMATLFAGLLLPFLSIGEGWEVPVLPPQVSDIQFQNTYLENTVILEAPSDPITLSTCLFTIWLIVAVFLLLRSVAGNVLAILRVSKATPVGDPAFIELADLVSQELGLVSGVKFFISEDIEAPVTCCVLRSKILLPGHFKTWSEERQRLVLLHEMAHVKRRDCLTQFITQIVCGVYWFNPLVWYVTRYLRELREQACDDHVLNAGTKSSVYAGHLLDIARSIKSEKRIFDLGRTATVAIARRSGMEARMLSILDPGRSRRSANHPIKLAVLFTLALFAVPLSALQLRSQPGEVFSGGENDRRVINDTLPATSVQDAAPKRIVRNNPAQKAERREAVRKRPTSRMARLAPLGPLQSSFNPLRGELAPLAELKKQPLTTRNR